MENQITVQDIKDFIARNKWIFAKTYAAFCPHEYVVKNRLSESDQKLFEKIAIYIREHGFPAQYGKNVRMYYVVDDRYYWTMGDPIPNTIIINRARLEDYIFEVTSSGLKVRRRRGDENIQTDFCIPGEHQQD